MLSETKDYKELIAGYKFNYLLSVNIIASHSYVVQECDARNDEINDEAG